MDDGRHQEFGFWEITPSRIEKSPDSISGRRLNLVLPWVLSTNAFAGVATALRLFTRLAPRFAGVRMILLNQEASPFDFTQWPEWTLDDGRALSNCVFFPLDGRELVVTATDLFLATAWPTAVYTKRVIAKQTQFFPDASQRFVYLLQDYEPGFYSLSDRYYYAKSTYEDSEQVIAVFNSSVLSDHFHKTGLRFFREYIYHPVLNPELARARRRNPRVHKERLIFVYARTKPRNGFDLIVDALKLWAAGFPGAQEWTVVSAGDAHPDVPLGPQLVLRSLGKLRLEEYASFLARCWVGLTFVYTPSSGYPRMEVAEFGAWVITNKLDIPAPWDSAPNIVAIERTAPEYAARVLEQCCESYRPGMTAVLPDLQPIFAQGLDEFPFVDELVNGWTETKGI
jgi:hypothetical protein